MEKIAKIKAQTSKHLSRLSRRIIVDIDVPHSEIVTSMDISMEQQLNFDGLTADDMMLFASGIINPSFLASH